MPEVGVPECHAQCHQPAKKPVHSITGGALAGPSRTLSMTSTCWEGASSDAAELTSKQDMNCMYPNAAVLT